MSAPLKTIAGADLAPALGQYWPKSALAKAAADKVAAFGISGRRQEAYRWQDFGQALGRFLPDDVAPNDAEATSAPVPAGFLVLDASRDGLAMDGEKPEGVIIALSDGEPSQFAQDTQFDQGKGPLTSGEFAAANAPKIVDIEVAEGAKLNLFVRRAAGAGLALRLYMRAGAEVNFIDIADGSGGSIWFDALLEKGANLTRSQLAMGGGFTLSQAQISLAEASQYHHFGLYRGADYARHQLDIAVNGEGAEVGIYAAYGVGSGQFADFSTKIEHFAPNGTTNEQVKGIVAAGGLGVFQGLIHVGQKAQQTNAQQNHRGLLLAEGARINAKPALEIYADDVTCAHGNTIGALDNEALFYMRQRGIDELTARAMLTEAFLGGVFDGLDEEAPHKSLILDGLAQLVGGLVQ